MMRAMWQPLCVALLVLGLVSAGASLAAEKKKPVRPPSKQTQVIRADIYKNMEEAQKAYEAKNYAGALASLDVLKAKFDKLNDYEKASLWNFYAAVYYAQDNLAKAREAYVNVLKQPNLPEGLRNSSMYALGQLYFIAEDYDKAIVVIKKWLSLVQEPQPDGHVLLAQAYYQQEKFSEAEKSLLVALRIARERQQVPKENWLALLRAVYYELKQYARSAKVLELLVTYYPAKAAYWQQLAGMYGMLDRQPDQLKTMHVAQQGKLLLSESDLLNLARLYMVEGAPYPAARVLAAGLKQGTIKNNPDNLYLYVQALSLAKEYALQAPVLAKLADTTQDGKHFLQLGQTQMELGNWSAAAEAFSRATKDGKLPRRGEAWIGLGSALYNAKRFEPARDAFAQALGFDESRKSAETWVRFMDQEIDLQKALKTS